MSNFNDDCPPFTKNKNDIWPRLIDDSNDCPSFPIDDYDYRPSLSDDSDDCPSFPRDDYHDYDDWPSFPKDELIIMTEYELTTLITDKLGDNIEVYYCQIYTPTSMDRCKLMCRFDEKTWIDVVDLGLKKDKPFSLDDVPSYYKEREPKIFERQREFIIIQRKICQSKICKNSNKRPTIYDIFCTECGEKLPSQPTHKSPTLI